VAAKGVKELAYHRDYAALWAVRLGLGTQESRRRMAAALEALWPFTDELFEDRPLAGGYVLACQSHPVTPGVRVDFDA
jgi:ring-1,2-phenylacetyl-CoA epoxidase subunit PaaC